MRRFATRLGALSVAFIMSAGLGMGTALADEPTSTEPPPSTSQPPPSSETPPPPPTTTEPTTEPPVTSDPAPPTPPPTTEPPPVPTTTSPPGDPAPPPAPEPPSSSTPNPEPPKDGPGNLAISAAFDKPTYQASDKATVRVTIKNTGSVAAQGVRASGGGDLDVWGAWGSLGTKPGVRIEPHTTRTTELRGRILNAKNGKVTFSAKVSADSGDADPADNGTFIEVPLIQATGTFAGMVFTDKNANGKVDSGEQGLAGLHVNISGGAPFTSAEQITDAAGKFSFGDIPTGTYSVFYNNTQGWMIYGLSGRFGDTIDIDESGKYADVRIPAVQPLGGQFGANLAFDDDTYHAGDTAHLTVTLTNRSEFELTGITVHCLKFEPGLHGGEGWGALAEGGPGLTLSPHSTTTVAVAEKVPDSAPRFGYVFADCRFTATGHPDFDSVSDADTATVPGVTASRTARIFNDANDNLRFEPGEELKGATVVVTDQNTGAVVATKTTGDDGRFTVTAPAGVYDLRVAGPWKAQGRQDWFPFPIIADDTGVPDYGVRSDSEAANNRPNLKVSATLDKPAYKTGDPVLVTVTVTNIGQVAAQGVHARPNFDANLTVLDWGELQPFSGPGARIEAGQTRTFTVTGVIREVTMTVLTLSALLQPDNGDINFGNNSFSLTAPVTISIGNYRGVALGEELDGTVHPVLGVSVTLMKTTPGIGFGMGSDNKGEFAFTNIPTGEYTVQISPPGEWVPVPVPNVIVDEVDDPPAQIRLVRPLSDTLEVSMVFQDDSYRIGDTARVRVAVTNHAGETLEHVRAFCFGGENRLSGDGEGWGVLRSTAAGLTIAAGETKTVDVTETVPEGADDFGFVRVVCGVGPADERGIPFGFDTASIIGKTGIAHGRFVTDRDGDQIFDDPVADVKVVLLDPISRKPMAKGRTGADGTFKINDVPPGDYDLVVVGPWEPVDPEFLFMIVYSNPQLDPFDPTFRLRPGPQQEDPFPDEPGTPPVDPNPAPPAQPQASAAPAGLASMGASVVVLAIVSLGLLVVGAGALLVGRRRRARES